MKILNEAFLSSCCLLSLAAFALAEPSGLLTPIREPLQNGIQLFEEHHLPEAMDAFLQVLRKDPANKRAHEYIDLITKEITIQERATLQQRRLDILSDVSRRLEDAREDPAPIQKAIEDTAAAEDHAREERWHAQCEQARMQRHLGNLLQANDLILRILNESPSSIEAQQELSGLQSAIRQALDNGFEGSIQERYALEGFYAYGQADYTTALLAWQKARAVVAQAFSPAEIPLRIQMLRFAPYQEAAQRAADEDRRRKDLKDLFEKGLEFYQKGHYAESLNIFRQLAIQQSDYPLLGKYLVQAEADAEKDRTRRLGEKKRQEMASDLEEGLAALEKERYQKASYFFNEVLKLDPSYSQARAYLTMARAEMERRHDPKAAQMHYETGLVAYASGKLEDAVREWKIAIRMDSQNQKAIVALNKAQKELALNQEVP